MSSEGTKPDDDGDDGDDSDDDGGDEDNAGVLEDQADAEEPLDQPLQHQGEAGNQHQGAEAGSGAGSRAVLGQRDLSTTQPLPSQPPIDRWRYVRPPPGGKNRYIS